MGPRAGLDGRKMSSPQVSIPDRPARSQSLYRLSYPVHTSICTSIYSIYIYTHTHTHTHTHYICTYSTRGASEVSIHRAWYLRAPLVRSVAVVPWSGIRVLQTSLST